MLGASTVLGCFTTYTMGAVRPREASTVMTCTSSGGNNLLQHAQNGTSTRFKLQSTKMAGSVCLSMA
eukprot:12610308-Prorocentrum_lima.AAC.1